MTHIQIKADPKYTFGKFKIMLLRQLSNTKFANMEYYSGNAVKLSSFLSFFFLFFYNFSVLCGFRHAGRHTHLRSPYFYPPFCTHFKVFGTWLCCTDELRLLGCNVCVMAWARSFQTRATVISAWGSFPAVTKGCTRLQGRHQAVHYTRLISIFVNVN